MLRYTQQGKILDFVSTVVPPEHQNQGFAEAVVEAGFRYAQENGLKVIPSCSYVSHAFLRKRKEFLPWVASDTP